MSTEDGLQLELVLELKPLADCELADKKWASLGTRVPSSGYKWTLEKKGTWDGDGRRTVCTRLQQNCIKFSFNSLRIHVLFYCFSWKDIKFHALKRLGAFRLWTLVEVLLCRFWLAETWKVQKQGPTKFVQEMLGIRVRIEMFQKQNLVLELDAHAGRLK